MLSALKWMVGLGLIAVVGIAAGVYFAFFGAGPQVTYVTPDLVPIDLNSAAPSDSFCRVSVWIFSSSAASVR